MGPELEFTESPKNSNKEERLLARTPKPEYVFSTTYRKDFQPELLKQDSRAIKNQKTDLEPEKKPMNEIYSSYKCEYKAPDDSYYDFKRFAVSSAKYNSVNEDEVENFKTKRRFRAAHPVISSTLVHTYKRGYCNPITWECTPDMKKHVLKKDLFL